MKKLFILRHSKAIDASEFPDDIQRPLTERGRSDSVIIAKYMAEHGFAPDIAIASPSARTRETLEIVAQNTGFECLLRFPQKLYLASSGQILAEINRIEDKFNSLLVVGHNPGMHELVLRLCENADSEKFAEAGLKFPTSAFAVFEFPFENWRDVEPYSGELTDFIYPSVLK